MVCNSNDENNFPHKLLLTIRQILSLRKAFPNHTSVFMPLLKSRLSLLKSVVKPLDMLGLIAAASATDAAINKKKLGSGGHTTLIISNDDMQDLLKIVK